MSFMKKFGDKMKDTASSLSTKSIDVLEAGKLKLQKSQLENAIKDKKAQIGDLIYSAEKSVSSPDTNALSTIYTEIRDLENQIAAIEEKLHKEPSHSAPNTSASEYNNEASETSAVLCSNCGKALSPGAKFCDNCGQAQ